ncbi:COQ9 family protein [Marinibacterium profundimaris]|uniref:COQ9 family ubiquinone biosynthesis protein n=1 Tax=Marinibacterium profundimaris TaxID=1679460 RepID=A0A225NIE9_9RHOB|nr:COQ9 family protein [Marinibacterium profundimaris]OWU73504.1 COQ9 family ubiquinone biosynthesis protein [Marinibacterium profundimaris]
MTTPYDDIKSKILDAALIHVAFDGWTDATFRAAVADAGVEPALARAVLPRGPVDLALAYHQRGDQQMLQKIRAMDLSEMKFRDKVIAAVRARIEVGDKEAVRRGMTLFALPQHAADGAKALWATADLIWDTLGDTSEDVNWYTKRASLSAVLSSTVLYWLGDDSEGYEKTWDFLDRRINDVMQVEKLKAQINDNPLLKPLMTGPNWLGKQIRAPMRKPRTDWPMGASGS